MTNKKWVVLVISMVLTVATAYATTVLRMDLGQLTQEADLIITGTCTNGKSSWMGGNLESGSSVLFTRKPTGMQRASHPIGITSTMMNPGNGDGVNAVMSMVSRLPPAFNEAGPTKIKLIAKKQYANLLISVLLSIISTCIQVRKIISKSFGSKKTVCSCSYGSLFKRDHLQRTTNSCQ